MDGAPAPRRRPAYTRRNRVRTSPEVEPTELSEVTITAGLNLIVSLIHYCKKVGRVRGEAERAEAETVVRELLPIAIEVLGDHEVTLKLIDCYCMFDPNREAVLEEGIRISRRLLGASHPTTRNKEELLTNVREIKRKIAEEEASGL